MAFGDPLVDIVLQARDVVEFPDFANIKLAPFDPSVLWIGMFADVFEVVPVIVDRIEEYFGLVAGVSPLLFASEDMDQLGSQLPSMAETLGRWLVIMLAVNLAMTAAIGVYIVRRLGEPLLAIKRVLRQIGQGDLTARLRRGNDEKFGDLFDALTDTVESLHERVADAKSALDDLAGAQLDDAAQARARELERKLAVFRTHAIDRDAKS